MSFYSRRDFLKALGAVGGTIALRPDAVLAARQRPSLDFLIVGDSLIWGQGLEEKDKFYSLTADWLRREAFGREKNVDLKVKAHSGSTLKLHPDVAEKFKKAGREETFYLHPEVNVGFPSTWKQIEVAADEYKASGKRGADLIMLSGGITDITVAKVLDPFGDNKDLPPLIERYCRDDMYDVLEHAISKHPDASIVVIGYFPMVSKASSQRRLLNSWLESMDFPGGLKPLANNPVSRKLFFTRIRKKATERSRIFIDLSNKYFQTTIARFNQKHPGRAVFVRSPITEAESYEADKTLLFRMGKDGIPEDSLALRRSAECNRSLPELKKTTGVDHPVRFCEIAGVGHPDPAGSRAYFDEIRNVIASDTALIRRLAAAR